MRSSSQTALVRMPAVQYEAMRIRQMPGSLLRTVGATLSSTMPVTALSNPFVPLQIASRQLNIVLDSRMHLVTLIHHHSAASSVSAPHTQLSAAGSPPQAPQLYKTPPHPPPRSSPLRRARSRAAARQRRPHAETLGPALHPPQWPTQSLVAPLPPSPTAARAGRCRPTPAAGPCHLPGSTCSGSQAELSGGPLSGGPLWSTCKLALHRLVRSAVRNVLQHSTGAPVPVGGAPHASHLRTSGRARCARCWVRGDMQRVFRDSESAGPHAQLHAARCPPSSAPSRPSCPLAADPPEPSGGCAACAPPVACPFAILPAGPPSGRPRGLHQGLHASAANTAQPLLRPFEVSNPSLSCMPPSIHAFSGLNNCVSSANDTPARRCAAIGRRIRVIDCDRAVTACGRHQAPYRARRIHGASGNCMHQRRVEDLPPMQHSGDASAFCIAYKVPPVHEHAEKD